MGCSVSLGSIWYAFIIFSAEHWKTSAFSGPHQANYWDFKELHTLSGAESDGFYHIQVENGFGLWQHFHQPDSPGAVWISGCSKSLVQGRAILPGQPPHSSPFLPCSCWTAMLCLHSSKVSVLAGEGGRIWAMWRRQHPGDWSHGRLRKA